jgi:pimeloyl-ACP methyl ester carboxylesterase
MSVVLVHGMGGTEATWEEVAPRLEASGHTVVSVRNELQSLAGDVASTVRVIESLEPPVVLAGHSYGGAVITNAGNHDAVTALVYVAALAPDDGETVQGIVNRFPMAAGSSYMQRGDGGEWITDLAAGGYWSEIAWDLTPQQRESVLAETRWTADRVFTEPSGPPAWRRLPSHYVLATEDQTLPTEIQELFAARMGAELTRLPGSHYTPRVHPARVAEIIDGAAPTLVTR